MIEILWCVLKSLHNCKLWLNLKDKSVFSKICASYNLKIIKNQIMHFPSINVLKIDVHYQLEKHVLTKKWWWIQLIVLMKYNKRKISLK